MRIPADVDLPDRVLGPLTPRQVAVLAATAAALYGLWHATAEVLPLPIFLGTAAVVLAAVTAVVLGRRDGLTLDRLLLAAIRHHLGATRRIAAPDTTGPAPAWLATAAPPPHSRRRTAATNAVPPAWEAPARTVHAAGRDTAASDTAGATAAAGHMGVVDMGEDGLAAIAAASTLTFALRTPAEQDALVAGFGRYLHSLTAPVQVLIRAQPLDLSDQITALLDHADNADGADSVDGKADRGPSRLAREHAEFLAQLQTQTQLLRSQVLLVWREPPTADRRSRPARPTGRGHRGSAGRRVAEDRLIRRVGEATELLASIGITITPLNPAQAVAVLVACCNPGLPRPPTADTAGPATTITANTPTATYLEPDPRSEEPAHRQPRRPAWARDSAGSDDVAIERAHRDTAQRRNSTGRGRR
jgi:hypothetical protein